jgi:hypothetical protein
VKQTETNQSENIAGDELKASVLFSNFITKYLLYRKYLSPDSMWMRNKFPHWEIEQSILHWGWSRHHQDMNSPYLNINRLEHFFQNRKIAELDSLYNESKSSDLRERTKDLAVVQKVMGNIYRKGFAAALFGKDHERFVRERSDNIAENKEQTLTGQLKAINNWIEANYFEVTNLYLNDIGLLMGEVINDMQRISSNRILFPFLFALEPMIITSAFFLAVWSLARTLPQVSQTIQDPGPYYIICLWLTFIFWGIKRLVLLIKLAYRLRNKKKPQ